MNEPISTIDIGGLDFRLLDVSSELYALEDHLLLIENQMQQIRQREQLSIDEYIQKNGLSPDSYERDNATYEYYHLIDCLLPRFFRGAFLMALYAVYESAVTEVARLIQRGQPQDVSFDGFRFRGDFLDKAQNYYKNILRFDLCADEMEWCQIKKLLELRNAFAHVNGRLEMLKKKSRMAVENWARLGTGISIYSGYIVCDAKTVADIFDVVRNSLDDLVARYKHWDDQKNHA